METLSQFAVVAIIIVGVPIIGIGFVAGVIDLARVILGVDSPVPMRGEVVDRNRLAPRPERVATTTGANG
jgi:hypothetical protein